MCFVLIGAHSGWPLAGELGASIAGEAEILSPPVCANNGIENSFGTLEEFSIARVINQHVSLGGPPNTFTLYTATLLMTQSVYSLYIAACVIINTV